MMLDIQSMYRNLSRIVQGYRIQPVSPVMKTQNGLSNTSQDTSTGHRSKWSQSASKLKQQETLQDSFSDTEVFPFQEFSQRYADPTKDLDFVCREARLQDTVNRQNSIETDDHLLQNEWFRAQQRVIYAAQREYEWAIANGIAKEQARAVLPEGLTVSRLYVNGTLRSWLHYIELRSGNGTQKEHIEIAKACAEVISKVFPMVKEFVQE